ncbi:hypothetical protein DOY81_003257 [Sarcophaga bullata]|nr:hypothetical protein DOY81_003257 [Sarcophaga bullata]
MAGTSFDRFNKIMKITRLMATICGADVTRPDYKMSIITWTVIVAINAYFACTIYTMYVGVIIDKDWKVILQSLCLTGTAIQGYSKLLYGIHSRLIIIDLNKTLDNIYIEYEDVDVKYRKVLRYRTDLTTKLLKMCLAIYIFTVVMLTTYPLVYGSIYGEKLLVMQFLLPGIDPMSPNGFLMHNIFHVFLIILGGFGNFAGDMYLFIFILHIPLLKDVLKIKCEMLSEVAAKAHDARKTMAMLKEIVECHQDYNKYVKQVEQAYYGVIFVEISTAVVNVCCTLFSIIIGSWPAAFSYLIYSCTMLYAYCGLGHLVELSNDEVLNVIYGGCLWYELSVPEQKLILLMIRKSQKPTNLTIGNVMPLSMSTALKLTKAIYSYMMMLVNFLETDNI